jgi:hypothetical protein
MIIIVSSIDKVLWMDLESWLLRHQSVRKTNGGLFELILRQRMVYRRIRITTCSKQMPPTHKSRRVREETKPYWHTRDEWFSPFNLSTACFHWSCHVICMVRHVFRALHDGIWALSLFPCRSLEPVEAKNAKVYSWIRHQHCVQCVGNRSLDNVWSTNGINWFTAMISISGITIFQRFVKRNFSGLIYLENTQFLKYPGFAYKIFLNPYILFILRDMNSRHARRENRIDRDLCCH